MPGPQRALLLDLDTGFPDNRNPLAVLVLQVLHEIPRRHGDCLCTKLVELLRDFRILQDLRHRFIELVDNLSRRTGGRKQTGEGLSVEVLVVKFAKGRHVRNPGRTICAGHSEGMHHAAFNERKRHGYLIKRKLNLSPYQVIGGRSIAAVVDRKPLKTERGLDELTEEMVYRACPGRGHRQLARLAADEIQKFL